MFKTKLKKILKKEKNIDLKTNYIKRNSEILPSYIGNNFQIHNGNKFIMLFITENMVGHKFGEFVPTRKKHVYKK
jgi:small subunit ribosomal protein S19|uniref:Ribosomal protein S19 n=1 Tax=Sundstroemia setigera TaxID=3005 RepID=A0A8A6KKN1_9STRA|nr:ribosomal protein S19 [Rhizosolenia setigera]QTI82385.1 ribosomal protein S19 [Rhizosolenia setigera]WAQ69948.1 ribosomal protein S19 [Rhizosolenia setigera]WAQ69984.1 ribosomal protein S19 [Rhizosolenia setigera]WAQ70020.1 ribosomal protein S19 [Rhizosolenia setigera]WAQ70056.1 ribosomal protein S19 [Rhizosolenia setigera]